MISVSHKFIFIHLPKCGGTSLANVLAPYCVEEVRWGDEKRDSYVHRGEGDLDPHMKYSGIIDQWKDEWGDISDFTKVGCVRNPYARAVSFFYDKNFGPRCYPDDKDELRKLFKDTIGRMAHSWEYYTLNHGNEYPKKWEMDFYIKLENIQEDSKKVLKHLGISCANIPHKNKSNKYDSWKNFYQENETFVEIVEDVFKEDIYKFNYTL